MTNALTVESLIHVSIDDDNDFWCNEFGKIDSWHSALHCGHTRGGSARTCVHRTQAFGRTTMFGIEWVSQLDWRATLVGGRQHPIIASRTGDVVTLMCDRIGRINGCVGVSSEDKPKHKWEYKLHRVQFYDDETPHDRIYLGAWIDSVRH